jgi:GTP-binding protein LepA
MLVHRTRAVRAFRKDVTAKCYGGDISASASFRRSRRKARRRCQYGKVDIPQEAFIAALKVDV